MSLRFKIFLTSLLSALIVAGGSIWLFSNSWVDLARSYGLLEIKSRLNALSVGTTEFKPGEWAVTFNLNSDATAAKNFTWHKKPNNFPENQLNILQKEISDSIAKTNLNEGSFEFTSPKTSLGKIPFFVVFQNSKALNQPNQILVAGTQDQLALERLSPLAAPFLIFVVVALLIAAIFSILFSNVLNKAYTTLERTLEDITAGRLDKLKLPESSDLSVQKITRAIKKLVETLDAKEQQIGEVPAMAHEDPMTKIPNFRAFNDYVKRQMPEIKASKELCTVLVIIDLDFFKKVNDNYGHQVGDFVLIHAARAIKSSVRHENPNSDRRFDFCARYGGEEFVAIFNGVLLDQAHVGPQRILQAIRDMPLDIPAEISSTKKGFRMNVTCSMGMAVWDNSRHQDKDAWIKEADEALYAAKKGGRARLINLFPEQQEWQ
ncbi:diguanylate cyclase [bacterium]|nr:diguanylate cyclase [bacterium]